MLTIGPLTINCETFGIVNTSSTLIKSNTNFSIYFEYLSSAEGRINFNSTTITELPVFGLKQFFFLSNTERVAGTARLSSVSLN